MVLVLVLVRPVLQHVQHVQVDEDVPLVLQHVSHVLEVRHVQRLQEAERRRRYPLAFDVREGRREQFGECGGQKVAGETSWQSIRLAVLVLAKNTPFIPSQVSRQIARDQSGKP